MKSQFYTRAVSIVFTLALLPAVIGCASGASVDGMSAQAQSVQTNEKLRRAVAVGPVEGGQETNPLWTSKISNENFKKALAQSLRNSGLEAESLEKARYTLTAKIKDVDQPWLGFSMTVQTIIGYVLTDRVTNKTVLSEDVTAGHTAEFSEAFFGWERLKLANEGSAKQNISKWISSLQSLDPDRVATNVK